MTKTPTGLSKMALVVHPDMSILSQFQVALSEKSFTTIVARDLPTALLAITQHQFDVAIVASHLGESGDGWPLAGVLHLVFPCAFIGVLTPSEPDVLTLQAAINYGVQRAFPRSLPIGEVVDSIGAAGSAKKSKVAELPVQ